MSIVYLKNFDKGQSLLDFIILMSVVAVVFFSMNTGIRRGIQSIVKTAADYIGDQEGAEQDFDEESSGHLDSSITATRSSKTNNTRDFPGVVSYDISETTDTMSEALINQGFVESTD